MSSKQPVCWFSHRKKASGGNRTRLAAASVFLYAIAADKLAGELGKKAGGIL
jgi:hypothetical protein